MSITYTLIDNAGGRFAIVGNELRVASALGSPGAYPITVRADGPGWSVDRTFEINTLWSPAALFASGEVGAWYDPSDLTTLFQDSTGTTPVTADGDPVGMMMDKSGNGRHLIQATSAARPTYKTSGGLRWLRFDGVDDYLARAASAIPLVDMLVVMGWSEITAGVNRGVLCLGPSSGVDWDSTSSLVIETGNASTDRLSVVGSTSFSFLLQYTGSNPAPKSVASMVKTATRGDLWIDGNSIPVATDTAFDAFAATNSGSLIIGARRNSAEFDNHANIDFYGAIIRGAATTTGAREAAEDWMIAKTGVTP